MLTERDLNLVYFLLYVLGGLNREEALNKFLGLKRESLWERGRLIERRGLKENFR